MALHIDEIAIQLAVDAPGSRRARRKRRRGRGRKRVDGFDDHDDNDDDDDDDEFDDDEGASSDADCCDHQEVVADAVRQVLKILAERERR